ncbi:hypothetical protein V6Z12_A06G147300 [Gossypium hirsutum]
MYLKGFLHGQTDKQLFKKNVLIVTYEDVKPYIDRIVSGETSDILLTKPITGFFLSVGTLGGQPKLMPVIAQVAKKWELFRGLYESPVIKFWFFSYRTRDFEVEVTHTIKAPFGHLKRVSVRQVHDISVATNVAARGLDINDMQLIIQENDWQKETIKRCTILFEGFFDRFEHLRKCCYR